MRPSVQWSTINCGHSWYNHACGCSVPCCSFQEYGKLSTLINVMYQNIFWYFVLTFDLLANGTNNAPIILFAPHTSFFDLYPGIFLPGTPSFVSRTEAQNVFFFGRKWPGTDRQNYNCDLSCHRFLETGRNDICKAWIAVIATRNDWMYQSGGQESADRDMSRRSLR